MSSTSVKDGVQRVFVHLKVRYMTQWGERVVIYGEGALLGAWNLVKGYNLRCHHVGDELEWETIISVSCASDLVYRYAVLAEDDTVVKVDTETRRVAFPEGLAQGSVVKICDEWQDTSNPAHVLASSAFNVIFGRHATSGSGGGGQEGGEAGQEGEGEEEEAAAIEPLEAGPDRVVVRFRVWDWDVLPGQRVAVSGNVAELGCGDRGEALQMVRGEPPCWLAEIAMPPSAFPFTYNYLIANPDGSMAMEQGEPRHVDRNTEGDPLDEPVSMLVRHDGYVRHSHLWRGAGLAVPVFSLRTTRSVGVGDFQDVCMLVRLCAASGLHLAQLLPVNDTCVHGMWWDSYPYCSLSVFALHPLYLAPDKIMDPTPKHVAKMVEAARESLEQGAVVDYEEVMRVKMRIARKCFEVEGATVLDSEEFCSWFDSNRQWLRPYAVFCFMRDLLQTSDHRQWGAASADPTKLVDRVCDPKGPHYAQIMFHWYLQWHLHRQLLHASRYAAHHRVALKGDLPIGVDKCSVDTWMHPQLFRMQVSTGAPPDFFNANGQNWGFPTYDWEAMAKDGYAWWRARLQHMAQYFHAYRIDHILGFFRIWEIPGNCCSGMLGHFRPSHPIWSHELEARGVWDFDRLCEPYVTLKMLQDKFGDLAYEVAGRYFTEGHAPRLRFREQYSSEEAIESLSVRSGSPEWLIKETDTVRQGLMELRQNLVLIRDPEHEDRFYPRIGLMHTDSFKELNPWWQQQLAELHDDYYYRRQDTLWREQAMRTLPALQGCTDMLVCGEDLGMIPGCVHPTMDELGLVGLRIQRMSADAGAEFGDPSRYPYMVVASPSCHDTPNLRAWWEEDRERSERFFVEMLEGEEPVPPSCTPAIARQVVRQHMQSPAMWTIFTIQDLMAMTEAYSQRPAAEETINDPTKKKHYWRYRIHVCLETLLGDAEFVGTIRALTRESGRNQPEDSHLNEEE